MINPRARAAYVGKRSLYLFGRVGQWTVSLVLLLFGRVEE